MGAGGRIYLGWTDHRATRRAFALESRDRPEHVYVVGKTGTGKSTLIRTLALQDIAAGQGVAVFDPHGDLAEGLLSSAEAKRPSEVIYLNTPAGASSWRFNPLAGVAPAKRSLAAAGIVDVFKKLWRDDWGPRLEHLLRNTVFTLLETPGATFADVPRLLTDRSFRKAVVQRIGNEEVRSFWHSEYDRYSPGFRAVVAAPLQNKIGAFLTDPLVRSVLVVEKSSFDLREIMDSGKVLLVNLSKGQIGEGPAALLGSLLISHLSLAALSRADQGEQERRSFWVYLDEFHTFSTLALATMLAELRKYRVGLTLAHQYQAQLQPEVRDAVIGNAGTIVAFRVGAKDAAHLAREFSPTFGSDDLVNLPNYHIYLRLMINAQVSKPFSARTFASFSDVPR